MISTLISKEDKSANFQFIDGQEVRYVRRDDEYFIAYLSSHNGCNQACRFCHLTQTKQVQMLNTGIYGHLTQFDTVLGWYKNQVKSGKEKTVKRINVNWMARGEPLLNHQLMYYFDDITQAIYNKVNELGIEEVRYKISTIMPESGIYPIKFNHPNFELYYSLYSTKAEFRKRWLPRAMVPSMALELLLQWQHKTGLPVVLHWALIEGENDSIDDANAIAELVNTIGLKTRFNLVRYNPYSSVQGKEPSEEVINNYFNAISSQMTLPGSRIVPRVGPDVFASCGMFIDSMKTN